MWNVKKKEGGHRWGYRHRIWLRNCDEWVRVCGKKGVRSTNRVQFSVSDASDASVRRVCRLRTFQCRHCARLSNQSYTRSWQQMDGTG